MSGDTELSTDDLAQPGGTRQAQPGGTRQEAPPPSGDDRPGGTAGATAAGRTGAAPGGTSAMGDEDRDVGQRQGSADAAGPPGGAGADPGDGTAARDTGAGGATGVTDTRETRAGDRAAMEGDDREGGGANATGAGGAPGNGQEQAGAGAAAPAGGGADIALLDPADEERFRQRWSDVQARFVDDPQEAVQTADGLVAELMQSLASGFSGHKGRLEAQWQSGGNPDTEELRQALQRYRSFFNRLLST
jgi:hypothetical protein